MCPLQFDMIFFKNNSTAQLVMHAIKKGSLQDMAFMIRRLRALLGDQTFLEAYERTGNSPPVTLRPGMIEIPTMPTKMDKCVEIMKIRGWSQISG